MTHKVNYAIAALAFMVGCNEVGRDETVVGPCPAGYVRDAMQPGNVCVRVGNDGGAVDPSDLDQDGDRITPRNGDCDDRNAQVGPGVTPAQARALCQADPLGNDGIDFDCAGSAPVCRAECGVASDCNDGDSCTVDRCANGRCERSEAPDCLVVCDDEIGCTRDARSGGRCEYAPDDALCGADERCDPATGCAPRVPADRCRRDADCSDGLVCNGAEQCEDGRCVRGDPVRCPDPGGCLAAYCSEREGGCVSAPEIARCRRGEVCDPGIGECVFLGECGSDAECDDGNRCNGLERCGPDFACRRGFPVVCEDGNPRTVDLCVHSDGSCTHTPSGRCLTHSDCDDSRFCNGTETCSADGECRSGTRVFCPEREGMTVSCDDGVRGCVYERVVSGCEPGMTRDCTTACGSSGRQTCGADRAYGVCSTPEICGNGRDDDCDGLSDEGCVVCAPSPEVCNLRDDDCDGLSDEGSLDCGVGACRRTVQMCVGGSTQTCIPGSPSSEICNNGIDEDCDGVADDGCGGVVNPVDQTSVRNLCFDVLEASFPSGSCTPSGWTAVVWDREGNANRGAPSAEMCISTVGYRRGGYVEFSAQCSGVYYDAWSVGRRCSEHGCRVTADGRDVSAETTVVARNPRFYLP